MASTNCTMRWSNCVRTPLLSEPLSMLICTRSSALCSVALSLCHHAASVSTMQSLVLEELPKVTYSCAVSSSTIPHGIYFPCIPGHDHWLGDHRGGTLRARTRQYGPWLDRSIMMRSPCWASQTCTPCSAPCPVSMRPTARHDVTTV